MNWKHVWAIARKDLRETTPNSAVWIPMLVVPLIFVVIMPLAMILIPRQFGGMESLTNDPDLQTMTAMLGPEIERLMGSYTSEQFIIVMMLGYLFAPMFLILPLMFSTTIACESFAGEKERKTLEALLYSPATDAELLLGKIMAGLVPAIVISWLSFAGYALVLNIAAWPVFGRVWFPMPHWWPMIFWLTPALALLGVGITVLISKKVKTFMGAYQTSTSSVLLVLALIAGQAFGVFTLNVWVGMLLGLLIFIADAILLWFGARTFNRKAILAAGD
jgi:ABC-type Na+ efflux pump permease subunit